MSSERLREGISEDMMTAQIRQLVVDYQKGFVWHIRDSSRAPELEHMPDLLVLAPRKLAVVELKSQHYEASDGQERVQALLATVEAVFLGLVRPTPRDGERSFDEFMEWLR